MAGRDSEPPEQVPPTQEEVAENEPTDERVRLAHAIHAWCEANDWACTVSVTDENVILGIHTETGVPISMSINVTP